MIQKNRSTISLAVEREVTIALTEIGHAELPMLKLISLNPDADIAEIADSCRRLQQAGFGSQA